MTDELKQFMTVESNRKARLKTRLSIFFKRYVKWQMVLALVFIILFIFSVFSFATYEFIQNPEVYNQFKVEGKNPFFEASYWLVVTLATVGYGDITPHTFKGKVITIILIILGVSLLGFLITLITNYVVSTNLGDVLGINKTTENVDYILCGWNKISEATLKELMNNKDKYIVLIDKQSRPAIVQASSNVKFISGDPTKAEVLKKANIESAKNIILAMDNDSDVLLAIHIIRDINPWINIVAKVNHNEDIKLVEEAGADQVVSPPAIGGKLLSIASEQPTIVKWMLNTTTQLKGLELKEYVVGPGTPYHKKTIEQIKKLLKGKARIIGLDTADGFVKLPHHEYIVKQKDKLVLLVDKTKLRD